MSGNFALKASLGYAMAAFAWKFFSDRLFARLFDHNTFVVFESYKGFAFITVTAVLLYVTLKRFAPRSSNGHIEGRILTRRFIVWGASILSLVIAAIAWVMFQNIVISMEQTALDEAQAIINLKASDLGRWLLLQKANAAAFAIDISSQGALDRIDLRGFDRGRLYRDVVRQAADFSFVAIDFIDSAGRSFFGGNEDAPPEIVAAAAKAFSEAAPVFVDLHLSPETVGPRFGFVIPLAASAREGPYRLALYAELNASDYLYPFVKSWPLAHATGSGVLARRDGGDVLFLSGLPSDPEAALHLRLPYATSAVPIVRFMRGEEGPVRGVDPSGTRVVAAGTKVPGTEWELVARINESDVLANENQYARTFGLAVTIAVATIWVIAGFLLQGQQLTRARADRRIQKRFLVTFDQAAVAMAHGDLDGNMLRVNQRACELFGYSHEAMLANNFLRMCCPDDLGALREQLERMRSGALREYFAERRYHRKDGTIFDAAVSVSLARGEDGDPDYLMIVIEDISSRKAVQAALQQSEERFRLALEGAKEGVWDWRPQTDESYFSPGWKAMLGYADDEIENHASAWRRVIDPEGREIFRKQFAEIRAGQRKTFEFETRMRHREGHWLDILSRGLPVFDGKGRMERVVGTDVDITLRKSHETETRLAAAVFASTHEGVVVTDRNRNIVMVNPAFEEITGYSDDNMLGKNMRMLQSGRHDRQFYDAMWSAVREHGVWRGEIWNRRKNGEIYPQWLTISVVQDGAGDIVNYVGLCSDISRLKQTEERLKFLAHHDPLTSLPNRTLLSARIELAIMGARRARTKCAVLFLDLDRFKTINDSLGHTAGDDLLIKAAERWQKTLRPKDTLARVGGDEFVVLLTDISDPSDAAAIAQRLIEQTANPFLLSHGREAFVGLSVGVSLFPNNGNEADLLIQHADSALYLAKKSGGAALRFYSDAMTREANVRLELEAGIRRALDCKEFVLQFQPLVSLKDRKMVGVEALVRWLSPSGLIPPDQFIARAERTGLIVPLGEWVLREACTRMKSWLDQGADIRSIAVNLSPVQLRRADIAERVKAILDETSLPADCLELEITESALAEQGGEVEARLRALKALGLRIAIDDFGAGHSSLFYLKSFPIDKLKLDRDFVKDIPSDPVSMEIAVAVIRLANSLKVTALAEGVETAAQADFLTASGCALAQGYLFDKPLWENDLIDRFGASRCPRRTAI